MANTRASLIIPVENQVRELDAKLLLACAAARRGLSSLIGPRLELDFRIASFPRSIYLSKSMTARSIKMFRIMRKLGHEIVAWDEEALVHMEPEAYFNRRMAPISIAYVSALFAWGQESAELLRKYPELPVGTPIHITGNPRCDLLRPEMHAYFKDEAEEYRKVHGEFILVNTNFGDVNAFVPALQLFLPAGRAGQEPRVGGAAVGLTREYAEGLRDHKQAIFEDFKRVIPALEKSFPHHTIVVRPHPTENPRIYHEIASHCERVRVTTEGNVIAWLLAAKALVHNGCTTGVEAYVMGAPAIAYQATLNEYYDYGYYRLPNLLSHQCFDFEELRETLGKILSGELAAAGGDDREALIHYHLVPQDGPLACERMVDVLEGMMNRRSELAGPTLISRLDGRCRAATRHFAKWCQSYVPGSKYRPEFQRRRYPGISLEECRSRISRFQKILGHSEEIRTEEFSDHIFRVSL